MTVLLAAAFASTAGASLAHAAAVPVVRKLAVPAMTHTAPRVTWAAPGKANYRYRVLRDGVLVTTTAHTSFLDSRARPGRHAYTVRTVLRSSVSAKARPVTTVLDTAAPSVPGTPSVSLADGRPTLVWGPSTDAGSGLGGYRVYRDGTRVATVSSTVYNEPSAPADGVHSYTVTAVDRAGNVSAAGAPATIVVDATAPSVPVQPAVVSSGPRPSLAWSASADAGSGVASYLVYRDGVQVAAVSGPAFAESADLPEGSYSYAVAAVDGAGNVSATSFPATAVIDVTAPSVPAAPVVAVSGAGPSLTWAASADAVSGVAGYVVDRDGVEIATVAGTTFTEPAGLPAGSYVYTVAAVDGAGNVSAASAPSTAVVGASAPGAPSQPAVTVAGGVVSLSWSAPTGTGSGVAGYRVYRDGVQVGSVTGPSFTEPSALADGTYTYGVTAVDPTGVASPMSETVAVAVDQTPPGGVVGLGGSVGGGVVSLSWGAAVDVGSGVAGYDVLRDGVVVDRVAGLSWSVAGFGCGSSAVFGVRAVDGAGNLGVVVSVSISAPACGGGGGISPTPGGLSVARFGASGSGSGDDSAAFKAALAAASSGAKIFAGGPGGAAQGVVYVPAGTYRLYNVVWPSNVRMEVDAGAVLEVASGKNGSAFLWGNGVRNVSLVGVGQSSAGKPVAAAGWDISHSFTFNLDPKATNVNNESRGLGVTWVDGFLIENVFMIQDNSCPSCGEGFPNNNNVVIGMRSQMGSTQSHPELPTNGEMTNLYTVHSPRGYGGVGFNSSLHVDVNRIYNDGGEPLRLETGSQPGRYSVVDDVTATTVEGRNCNSAVAITPHDQRNGVVHISDVTATSCQYGVKVMQGGPMPQNNGVFSNSSTVNQVTVTSGTLAQILQNGNHFPWNMGTSSAAINLQNETFHVNITNLTCTNHIQSDLPCS